MPITVPVEYWSEIKDQATPDNFWVADAMKTAVYLAVVKPGDVPHAEYVESVLVTLDREAGTVTATIVPKEV